MVGVYLQGISPSGFNLEFAPGAAVAGINYQWTDMVMAEGMAVVGD
jgi:hypothetical protein